MDEDRLVELKQEIDEAKKKVSQLEGRKEQLMEQLSEQWKCKTIKEAEKKLETMQADLEKMNTQIEQGLEELEEKYHEQD